MSVTVEHGALSPSHTLITTISRSPKSVTPIKGQLDGEEWKSCYELTDNIAAIYPSTVRIPYPFAIPREVRFIGGG